MKQIKMIGLDLDGTLLTDQKKITDHTRKTLIRAIEKGVTVLVATGRPVTGVPKEFLEIPGVRYALTANGGRILDLKEKKVLYEELVPYDMAVQILKIYEEYDTLKEIYFEGVGFVQEDELARISEFLRNPAMAEYILSTRTRIPNIWEKLEEMHGHGLDKVHALFTDQGERREAAERVRKLADLEVTTALENNVEVNAAGVNKGNGLLMLGKLLGIEKDEIMACGDGDNDLAMIETVGFGVAMANASESVKQAADYITLSNDEEGVACAIEKFVL